ncbi:hypothetical protein HELRODRAFT_192964 [Helobdella robusta]|uniref:SPARC/Testican calcium-binding domain-containing protein n=1 Tax=Helobdella robusta TaxID=6412 RepID=T1FUG7_HELRO|nr:hypothetical protein HELRODRAFT_192964 [Helobdella robusta]ESN98508.1 hypothetical protein HELRODRAFT_192964 [Helobdella robusta]
MSEDKNNYNNNNNINNSNNNKHGDGKAGKKSGDSQSHHLEAAKWKFSMLDANKDQMIDRAEANKLKIEINKLIRSNNKTSSSSSSSSSLTSLLSPSLSSSPSSSSSSSQKINHNKSIGKCSRRYVENCDSNRDGLIDSREWMGCLGFIDLQRQHSIKRSGRNPFSKVLT